MYYMFNIFKKILHVVSPSNSTKLTRREEKKILKILKRWDGREDIDGVAVYYNFKTDNLEINEYMPIPDDSPVGEFNSDGTIDYTQYNKK